MEKSDKPASRKSTKLTMNQSIISSLKILQEYEKIYKNPFKANAYAKVIDSIELYDKDIKTTADLKEIKGIGKSILEKITELLTTGKIDAVEQAKQDPKFILGKQLSQIYGIGPAKIEELLESITEFDDLYKAEKQKLLNEKQKIGLKYYKDLQTRIPYAEGKQHYKIIEKVLKPHDITFEMVGSYRRKAKDLGDIDILIQDNQLINLNSYITMLKNTGYIIETLALGKKKFMGIVKIAEDLPARRIDILVVEPEHYPFSLAYFTGSYQFNIHMRRVALQKGLSLSEYGFKDNATKQMIDTSETIKTEEDIFKYLDMAYVPPNKR